MENLPTQKELVLEKANKIDNYAKYVREMYWPKVSVKKQLELEHVKGTLKNQAIRKEDEEQAKKAKYDKPWREAMVKNPRYDADGNLLRNNSSNALGLPPYGG